MTLRLLVADDNAAMQKMIQLAFAGEDVVIKAVSSGDAAIDMLHKFHPDVVLTDISMPGYNGYEVCELIRRDQKFAAVPVILLNGAFDIFDEMEAARVGASGHLTKPFNPSEIIGLVERLLREPQRRSAYDFSDNSVDKINAETEITAETPAPPVNPVAELRESDETSEAVAEGAERNVEIPDDAGSLEIPSFESNKESDAPRFFFPLAPRAWESYLGPDRILDIFNDETLSEKASTDLRIPDGFADRVAEKVAEKMFPAIENLILRTLEKRE